MFGGREGRNSPFVSIHRLDKGLELLGSDDNLMNFTALFTEGGVKSSDPQMLKQVTKMIHDMKFGYCRLSNCKETVFNIRFLTKKDQRFILISDYKERVAVLELRDDNSLIELDNILLHDGIYLFIKRLHSRNIFQR